MAYNEQLAERLRRRLAILPNIAEKKMMGGLVFMYNEKMCVGVTGDELMCRINPAMQDEVVEKNGCRQMKMNQRGMNGYVLIDETGIAKEQEFEYWIGLSLEYNRLAKSSKKNIKG